MVHPIPAGGYPMLLFARETGFHVDGAPVLNGLPVTVAAAETAVRLARLNRTGTSRRAAYALPSRDAVADFERLLGEARGDAASAGYAAARPARGGRRS